MLVGVLVCRIRNPDMSPVDGVTIMDMGHKYVKDYDLL